MEYQESLRVRFKTLVKEIQPTYKSDTVGVQAVRWDNSGTKPANTHIFHCQK
jgi:hypothetical protein